MNGHTLHGSIHSELVTFQFRSDKLKVAPEAIPNYNKEDHAGILGSKTLEEYIAGIIKDKPVNIDRFFDYVVKEVLKRNVAIIARLQDCLKLATESQNDEARSIVEQALENYQPHFSKDFQEYIKWQDSQKTHKEPKDELPSDSQTPESQPQTPQTRYAQMKFRDLYNLIEEHPPCHQVIERELETIANSNRALWDAFLTVLPRISARVLPILRQKYEKLADEKLAALTNHKTVCLLLLGVFAHQKVPKTRMDNMVKNPKTNISSNFVIDFDEQYVKFYKEDPEYQRTQEHFQGTLEQLAVRTSACNQRLHADPKTAPYFYEYQSIRVPDAPQLDLVSGSLLGEHKAAVAPEASLTVDLVVVCPSTCTTAAGLARLCLALHRHNPGESFRVYLSVANDGDPGAQLYLMSLRFAEEVKGVIKGLQIGVCGFVGLWVCGFVGLWVCGFVGLWVCGLQTKGATLRSLGFLGFGTGGLVIRGALKELKDYKAHFGAFLTLGTPHLGNAEVKENFIGKGSYFVIN